MSNTDSRKNPEEAITSFKLNFPITCKKYWKQLNVEALHYNLLLPLQAGKFHKRKLNILFMN